MVIAGESVPPTQGWGEREKKKKKKHSGWELGEEPSVHSCLLSLWCLIALS